MTSQRGIRFGHLAFIALTAIHGAKGQKVAVAQEPVQTESRAASAALHAKSLIRDETPRLSPDGGMVVYTVNSVPAEGRGPNRGAGQPLFETPAERAYIAQSKAFVVSLKTFEAAELLPDAPNSWRPTWSPDGRSIAFFSDKGGAIRVWVYDVKTARARIISDADIYSEFLGGDEPMWSPAGDEIFIPVRPSHAQEQSAAPGGSENGVKVQVWRATGKKRAAIDSDPDLAAKRAPENNRAALLAVNLATGKTRIVVPDNATPLARAMRLSLSGKWLAYLSPWTWDLSDTRSFKLRANLGIAPVSGGAPILIENALEVQNGNVFGGSYRWSPQHDELAYLKEGHLWLLDPANPAGRKQLAAELGPLHPFTLAFAGDGRSILTALSENAGELALVSIESGNTRRLNIGSLINRGVIPTAGGALLEPEANVALIKAMDRATGELCITKLDFNQERVETLWRGKGMIDLFGLTKDQMYIGSVEDYNTPPDLYLLDQHLKIIRRVTAINPASEKFQAGEVFFTHTTVPGYDGKLISANTAVLMPPGQKRSDKSPAVVIFYPGSDFTRYINQFAGGNPANFPASIWLRKGYAVALLDTPLRPQNHASGNLVKEITDVVLPQVYKLADLGYIDVNRLALFGMSSGGWGTAAVLTQTNLFRAGIAVAGAGYDLAGVYGLNLEREGPSIWERGFLRMAPTPWDDFKQYIDNSPYAQADRINTPLLLVHGTGDNHSWTEPVKLFNALKDLGKNAELAIYEGEPHDAPLGWSISDALDMAARVVRFVDDHLAGDVTSRNPHAQH